METIDLFLEEEQEARIPAVISRAVESVDDAARRRILAILRAGHPAAVAFSGGKDSAALASLVLQCAVEMKRQGETPPPIIVTHSTTGVENPDVMRLAFSEIEKMKQFAKERDISFDALIGEPELAASFPVRVIGGRGNPAWIGGNGDCSVDWKVLVGRRLLDQAMRQLKQSSSGKPPVVMTGVRRGESDARDARILSRGEVAEGIWQNEFGDLRSSPLLDHTTDDVYEHLGLCAAGVYESYSDFKDVLELYSAAGGSSCVVVADMKSSRSRTACGARFGCWSCLKVKSDRSVETMIETDPKRYRHLQPLNRLRNWMTNTQYDWSLRQYVGRSIKDGYIEIAADTYSPAVLQKLLVYTLSAERLSGVPIISIQQLIAIDARWSMYGIAPPFSALKIYLDLVTTESWEEAPIVPMFPPSQVPRIGRIHVGTDWYDATGIKSMAGLRDSSLEMHHETCGVDLKVLRNGALVCDHESEDGFSVDADGAADFLAFMAEGYIRDYCHDSSLDWTYGYKTYLRMGILSIGRGQSRSNDEILRRSQWRQENNLHGQRSLEELTARCDVFHAHQQSLL